MRVAISVPTEAEYNELNNRLGGLGFVKLPKKNYIYHKQQTCIDLDMVDKGVYCSSKGDFIDCGYKIIPYSELKANNFKIEIEI
jgi:hypothetical protein